ncbi:MAG: hypothetical protein ACR2KT_14355 [Methylocella sp.]|nr:MAG: hypothetical protein DLM68_01695 [Hyphomicrobiales bacterium]
MCIGWFAAGSRRQALSCLRIPVKMIGHFRPKVITVSGDRDHAQCASFGVPGKDGAANTTGG